MSFKIVTDISDKFKEIIVKIEAPQMTKEVNRIILNLTNQNIVGDFVVDANSDLTINMVNSTITGTINSAKTADDLSINLDSASKITLTGNSYYTSISNSDKTGSNIINGSYSLSSYDDDDDDNDINRVTTNGKFIPLSFFLLLTLLLI